MSDVRPSGAGQPCKGPSARSFVAMSFFIPGIPQWIWRQRERGLILFGSVSASLSIGFFAWGTRTSLALIVFAYLAHTLSAADAIRQWSFPGFGRWVPVVSASAGLAVGCYGPLILIASLVAWPGLGPGGSRDGYLVNRLAYQGREPDAGNHVWVGATRDDRREKCAKILAGPGEEVEWADGSLRVRGRRLDFVPYKLGRSPKGIALKVPDGQFLVAFETGDRFVPQAWEMVPRSRIEGRVWAKLYPVWERKLVN